MNNGNTQAILPLKYCEMGCSLSFDFSSKIWQGTELPMLKWGRLCQNSCQSPSDRSSNHHAEAQRPGQLRPAHCPKDAEQINRIYRVTVEVQGEEIPVAVPCSPIEENTRSFHGQILWRYVLEVNKMNPIHQLAVSSLFWMNLSSRWTSSNTFVVDETSTVDSCSVFKFLTFLRKLSLPRTQRNHLCSLLTDFPNLTQKAWVTECNTTTGTRRQMWILQ